MSGIDQKQAAIEATRGHGYDRERVFRVRHDRNRRLGDWAAHRMGLAGPGAEAYVRAVVRVDFEASGDAEVQRKVSADLAEAGVPAPSNLLRSVMDRLHEAAWRDELLGAR